MSAKVKFKILDKTWTIRIFNEKKYAKTHGEDSVAITEVNKRRIDLSPSGTDLETIVHELVHAYLGEMCTYSADLDEDSLEEIYAELMAKRGYELLRLADRLTYDVKVLMLK